MATQWDPVAFEKARAKNMAMNPPPVNKSTGYGWQQGSGDYPGMWSGQNDLTYGTPFPQGAVGGGTQQPSQTGNAQSDAAVKYLNRVLEGKELPYDQATKANMLSEQSGMAAAAESAQNQELMNNATAGGASANDPSLAAAKRSNLARRQSANMGAARDIAQNANVQNFGAKEGAAKALATFGLAEQDRALQAMQAQAQTGYAQSEPTGVGWAAARQPFPDATESWSMPNYSANPYKPYVKPTYKRGG